MALGMLFLFMTIIILMLAASSVPSALMGNISGDGNRFGVFIVGLVISLSIAFGLFQMIYYLIPNKKMTLKKTWCGALLAAITLEIFIILFPLYVRKFMSNYTGKFNKLENIFKNYLFNFSRSNWLCCYSYSFLLLFCHNSYSWC